MIGDNNVDKQAHNDGIPVSWMTNYIQRLPSTYIITTSLKLWWQTLLDREVTRENTSFEIILI